jgi:hypothetical protein
MQRIRRSSGLWDFLEKLGKLGASGDELLDLRKRYRREYMKGYKQRERQRNRHYTLTFKRAETDAIMKAAKGYRLTENAFLKKAIAGYLATIYVVRDKMVLDSVFQVLLRYQTAIRQLQEQDKGGWFKPDRNYEKLNAAISSVWTEVTLAFANPPKLIDEIRVAIQNDPKFIEVLRGIIAQHDSEITFAKD